MWYLYPGKNLVRTIRVHVRTIRGCPDCPGESPDNPAPPEDLQMCLRMNDLELKSNEDLVA